MSTSRTRYNSRVRIGMIAIGAVVLAACDAGKKPVPHAGSSEPAAPRDAAVVNDALPIDAAADAREPDAAIAAKPPTIDEALTASATWVKAGQTKSPAKLRAASALPFHIIDEYDHPSCDESATIVDGDELAELATCLQNADLRPAFASNDLRMK